MGDIVPKSILATTPPFHPKHDPKASCAYHAGFIGHSTEDCWELKYKIQDLINQDILTFSEENPNVKTNPFQNHGGASVNIVVEEETTESILRVEDVKTPMSVVLQRLEQFGFLAGIHDDCAVCEYDPDNCVELRVCVQELMDQGLIQFSRPKAAEEVVVIEPISIVYSKKKVEAPPKRIQPIHFRVPNPFSYQNTKAVPWNYETTTYLGGKEICIPDTEIVNIAGAGGTTRNGRVFAPKYTHRVSLTPTDIPHKEKVIPILTPRAGATVPATPNMITAPVPTKVIDNKAAYSEVSKALLKVLNATHVMQDTTVDQFDDVVANITASRYLGFNEAELPPEGNTHNKALHISVMCTYSLLSRVLVDTGSSLNAHRKALLKVLNATHVMQDTTVDQFDDVVANITASRYLGFNEAELPPEGNTYNKALHISVMCTYSLLSRVLVDTGSSLNVFPKFTLSQLQFKGLEMRTITLIVRDFDGSQRPWIHVAGAVTSTLHQRLKFLIDDKLVIVYGEEDLLVRELSSFRYVESNEGIVEVPLHYLEFEEVSFATSNRSQSSTTIISSAKSAKQTLKKGPLPGWGKVVNMAEKHERFGIGYHPTACQASPKKKQFNPVKFNIADFQNEHIMEVIGESSDNKPEKPSLIIRICPPVFKLSNWMATVIPVVYS
ncbi:uncharacterized protein LOC127103553 [Lathyrus oleraceus]|uniref:uncharacterized protein LOC127103553 n=1 Tax=Pisum sativum TaxID=3888 RepID=UPI0021D21335|nr:uncharacterized protein LOC127103553 [Pisum sativum]